MDLYNVNKYSDDQLYDILDMSHPTDRELEAKLIQMIDKYESIPSDAGKQLYNFFNNIYKRFFDDPDSENDENTLQENMENPTSEPTSKPTPEPSIKTKQIGYQAQNITSVQQFDYTPDKLQLNPLLTQTIQRVISIDSQYRNIITDPLTTSFSFDLSEPLRDVVSLKLYSIQIPYTWYSVGKNFGSNFFYLTGTTTGVNNQKYKIAIPPGNYDQVSLPIAINTSFRDISNGLASDLNFNGLDLIKYDTTTAKTTVQLNIQNTFNESYYNIYFGFWTPPLDTINNKYSIPGYMGFNNKTYNLNSIHSNQSYYSTSIINSQYNQNYILDSSNNYFTVIQYLAHDPFTGFDQRSKILNEYKIQLMNDGFPYTGKITRQNIVNAVNMAITESNLFDTGSKIEQIDITNPAEQNHGNSYFRLNLTLNRFTTKYVPNAKVLVVFPSETIKPNQYDEPFTIWQYQRGVNYSCFYFDNSSNEFSQFVSESQTINSTFTIDTSTNIIMRCTTPTYKNGLNDFSMNIQPGTYNTLTQYLSAITTSFSNKNPTSDKYFNMTNTKAYLDENNTFNLQIDLTKAFENKNYRVVIDGNSFLTKTKPQNNFDIKYSIQKTNNTIISGTNAVVNLQDISYINITVGKIFNGYILDTNCIFIIKPDISIDNGGNGDSNPIPVILSSDKYSTYDAFINAIQNAFLTTSITSNIDTQTPLSRSIIQTNQTNQTATNVDISLNLNCYYYLGEANYDISFVDANLSMTDQKNAWNSLKIKSFYDLSNNISSSGYVLITGDTTVGSASASINIIDNCNNTITFSTTGNSDIPTETITVKIPPNNYTIGTLYSAINTELSKNPKTYGSIFKQIVVNNQEYTQMWININRIFTTQDYLLGFYDTTNFVSCYGGSKSVQNTTWDTSIGWMLGFHYYTQYFLTKQNQTTPDSNPHYLASSDGSYIINENRDPSSNLLISSPVYLTGDTTLNTNLYNYFLISLDDFIQNHLNDGLVTITRNQTSIQLTDSAYSTTQRCDPATGDIAATSINQANSNNVTNAQLYALNQSIISQQNPSKQYSAGPFIKDLFGMIPYKPPSATGDYYTEFGGSLQNQERLYFGPVNIRKMSIQLLTDRGTLLDLNGGNWTFSFVCEQLYRSSSSKA